MEATTTAIRTNIRHKVGLVALTAVGTCVVLGMWLHAALASPQLAWDFPVFYIAAKLPLDQIYSHAAFASFGAKHLAPLSIFYYPQSVRPAVFALLYRPFGIFAYWNAFAIWAGIGLAAYLVSIGIFVRALRLPAFFVPVSVAFFPAMVGLISGQDNCVFLFAIAGLWLLLQRQRDWLAGALLALCLYKFNLILLIPVLLLLKRRYTALLSFAIGAAALGVCSAALASPREYVHVLINSAELIPGYYPVGLKGFSAAIGQPWSYWGLAALALAVCCWLMKHLPFTDAFCIAIVGTLLISPHITWYDSTLLVLPLAVVFGRSGSAVRIACIALIVIQWPWLHGGGNNGPIGFTHVAVEVLLLTYFMYASGIRLSIPGLTRTSHAAAQ